MKINEFFEKTFTNNFVEEADAQYEIVKQEVEITVTKYPEINEIVKDWLKNQNFYDGLYNEISECGCLVDDLEPCSEMTMDCVPGIREKRNIVDCQSDSCFDYNTCDGCHIRPPRKDDYK